MTPEKDTNVRNDVIKTYRLEPFLRAVDFKPFFVRLIPLRPLRCTSISFASNCVGSTTRPEAPHQVGFICP